MIVPLQRLFALIVLLLIIFSEAYLGVMFDGEFTWTNMVEAVNYSTQTVTSVGYGNWIPTRWNVRGGRVSEADFHKKVLYMKFISAPASLLGAGSFAFVIGILVNILFTRPR